MRRHLVYWKSKLLTAGSLAVGVLVGTIMSASLAGSAALPSAQDNNAVMQLQQQMNSLRLELSNRMSTMEIDIDQIERRVVDLQNRLQPLENDLRQLALAPQAAAPRPQEPTAERVVSLDTAAGSELRLYDALGNLRVRLAASREQGELTLYDAAGNEIFRR
jgi:TolA-binding protein